MEEEAGGPQRNTERGAAMGVRGGAANRGGPRDKVGAVGGASPCVLAKAQLSKTQSAGRYRHNGERRRDRGENEDEKE